MKAEFEKVTLTESRGTFYACKYILPKYCAGAYGAVNGQWLFETETARDAAIEELTFLQNGIDAMTKNIGEESNRAMNDLESQLHLCRLLLVTIDEALHCAPRPAERVRELVNDAARNPFAHLMRHGKKTNEGETK